MATKSINKTIGVAVMAIFPFFSSGCAAFSSGLDFRCEPTKEQLREAYQLLIQFEQQPDLVRGGNPIIVNGKDKDHIKCLDYIMRHTGSGRIGILFDGEDYLTAEVVY